MKQHTQVLIIGQGLCGSWLSYFLQKESIDCIVIDEQKEITSSKIASGIINPVTGRRHVKTWMIDDVMPFAVKAYQAFDSTIIQQKNTLDFFPSLQMQDSFTKRMNTKEDDYLQIHNTSWQQYFNYSYAIGEINPCWLINVNQFINLQKERLLQQNQLLNEKFELQYLSVTENKISYKDITVDKIIFCDGTSATQLPFFTQLPFALNKGEALIIDCPTLPDSNIFKSSKSIVPWRDGLFWIGSSYQWQFDDENPSQNFKEEMITWLHSFLKLPYKIIDHVAAVRPATIERRPFVGFHSVYKNVGILNGMGTKGVSLAPYFANQLVQNSIGKKDILQEVNIV